MVGWQLQAEGPLERLRAEGSLHAADIDFGAELGLQRIGSRFLYRSGLLEIDGAAHFDDGSVGELDGSIPLATVAAIPAAQAIRAWPVPQARGPIVVAWEMPAREWSGLLSTGSNSELSRLLAGGSGRFTLDPACPTCADGEFVLQTLEIDYSGRTVRAQDPIRARLGDEEVQIVGLRLVGEGLELSAHGRADLDAGWRFGDPATAIVEQIEAAVDGTLDAAWLEAVPAIEAAEGTARLAAEFSGPLTSPVGTIELSAPDLALTVAGADDLRLARPEVRARFEGRRVGFDRAELAVGDGALRMAGDLNLGHMSHGEGTLSLTGALPVVEGAEFSWRLQDGGLEIVDGEVVLPEGRGTVTAYLPLTAAASRPLQARWQLPAADWLPLLEFFGALEGLGLERLLVASRGELEFDPGAPFSGRGEVVLSDGEVRTATGVTTLPQPLRMELRPGLLAIPQAQLATGDELLSMELRARTDRGWAPGIPVDRALLDLSLHADGVVDSSLLTPLLAGGRPQGPLAVDLRAEKVDGQIAGTLEVEGPHASFVYRVPYLARISEPHMKVRFAGGDVVLEEGSAQLNDGPLHFSGTVSGADGATIGIDFAQSLFRLDHGLLALLSGDLTISTGPDGQSLVAGKVTVERGWLTRDLQLDRDLLSQLLLPIDLTSTEDDPLEQVKLGLTLDTREGVWIRNNVGDLTILWSPLRISGSAALPVLEGSVEVEPGGLLYAYGQTLRLDRALIEYPGEVGVEPRLELEVTTSLEDPSIAQLEGGDPFRTDSGSPTADGEELDNVTEGVAMFYGEQLTQRLGDALGGTRISLRPVLIFGEADPAARLTVSRDFSANVALAASVNLRNAEDQTYLLEGHEFRAVPGFVGQLFTNDRAAHGVAALQRLTFGRGKKKRDDQGLRVGKVRFGNRPEHVSKRGLRRAVGKRKGAQWEERDRLAVEMEVLEHLAGRGYPAAEVELQTETGGRKGGRVHLTLDVVGGPYVTFEYRGEKLPKALRRHVSSFYRADFFAVESIEEMRKEAVRALRSRGFLEPTVEIEVVPADPDRPDGDRTVIVTSEGGARIAPEPPIFLGVPEEDIAVLQAAFSSPVQRVELAVGLEEADRRLLTALRGLGYVEPQIVSRRTGDGGKVLTVELIPGARRRIDTVELDGVPEGMREEADEAVQLAGGDPLRGDRLGRAARQLERRLTAAGYSEARVRPVVGDSGSDPLSYPVRFEVEAGALYRLAGVEFEGLAVTRPEWAAKVADLEVGEPYSADAVSVARSKLWRTSLFSSVTSDGEEVEGQGRRVTFRLAEHPRWETAFGARWDSEDGTAAVIDLRRANSFGRNVTLGLRTLVSSADSNVRWLTRIPRVFGERGSVEFFALAREQNKNGLIVDTVETTLQYSYRFGERLTSRVYGQYKVLHAYMEEPDPFAVIQTDDRTKKPVLGMQLLYDTRANQLLVERGLFASIDLSGSEEFLGSDFRYLRLYGQFSIFQPLGKVFGRRWTWAQSLRGGWAKAFDQELLRDVRFFAGGEYSVRGYGTESIGVQETIGPIVRPLGGDSLLVLNQELRVHLFGGYTGLLFVDAGSVWSRAADLDRDLVYSAGIGLRALTPVGLVRLDLAHALDRRPGIDPEFKLYFGLGSTF